MKGVLILLLSVAAVSAMGIDHPNPPPPRPGFPGGSASGARPGSALPNCPNGFLMGLGGVPKKDAWGKPACAPAKEVKKCIRMSGGKGPCLCAAGSGCFPSAFCSKNGGRVVPPQAGHGCTQKGFVCCSVDFDKVVKGAKNKQTAKAQAKVDAVQLAGTAEGGACMWKENVGYTNEKHWVGKCIDASQSQCPRGRPDWKMAPGASAGCTTKPTAAGGRLQCCAKDTPLPPGY